MKLLLKTNQPYRKNEGKKMTLGELIAATYGASAGKGASNILHFAMESDLLRFKRPANLSYFHR